MDAPNRRDFFRQFLQRITNPTAGYAEKHLPQQPTRLRPPGALPEPDFADTCRHCGQCAEVCPAEAIKIYPESDPQNCGTPYIDPTDQPCVACDGLELQRHECLRLDLVPKMEGHAWQEITSLLRIAKSSRSAVSCSTS